MQPELVKCAKVLITGVVILPCGDIAEQCQRMKGMSPISQNAPVICKKTLKNLTVFNDFLFLFFFNSIRFNVQVQSNGV